MFNIQHPTADRWWSFGGWTPEQRRAHRFVSKEEAEEFIGKSETIDATARIVKLPKPTPYGMDPNYNPFRAPR